MDKSEVQFPAHSIGNQVSGLTVPGAEEMRKWGPLYTAGTGVYWQNCFGSQPES